MTNTTKVQINILKISTCGKVSNPADHTLTYNIGYDAAENVLLVRITDNDGGGLFSSEWIALADVLSVIDKRPNTDKSFNARIFTPLFKSKSANNAGFLAAALKAENILVPFKASKRLHDMGDVDAFKDSMQPLIDDNISLHDVVAEREAAKAKVRAENERKLKAGRAKTASKSTSK